MFKWIGVLMIVLGTTMTGYEIYAEKKSVRQSEFYTAQQIGRNPQVMFIVDALDFESAEVDGESASEVEYNEKPYVIMRSYEKCLPASKQSWTRQLMKKNCCIALEKRNMIRCWP